MGLQLVTPPASEPATLDEAKAWCRVSTADEDTLLQAQVKAATRHIEKVLGISLMQRTWALTLDDFSDTIELPNGPVTSVTSIEYVDANDVTQTLSSSVYALDLTGNPQLIVRASGESWPDVKDTPNAVTVTYVAGYTTLPDVFEDLKTAILMLAAHWFNNREAVAMGGSNASPSLMPLGVDALMQPFRRILL